MNLNLFEGPAGSGKTTRLFGDLSSLLASSPLLPHQRVLALTKMHGSRRRMLGRLDRVTGLRGRFSCLTIDSFAWHIVRRWRSFVRVTDADEPLPGDYARICTSAGLLLSRAVVARWSAETFPVVIVDEMQDSKGGQLEIIRALSAVATCLVAADDFQDLDGEVENPAVSWARSQGCLVQLTQNHRTSVPGLLAAAQALRDAGRLPPNGNGFTVLAAPNVNVGAGFVARNLTWWAGSRDIAIITPVRPGTSRFVRELIARVERGPIGQPPVGPHRIALEISQEEECQQFLVGLGLPEHETAAVTAADLREPDGHPSSSRDLRAWLDQQRRLGGRTQFGVDEIRERARAIHQRSNAQRRLQDRGVRGMTIHQAKNREFESVIVLWPYEVVGSDERKRRLLYNAITRARRQALVVVQNPARLGQPPFVCSTPTTPEAAT